MSFWARLWLAFVCFFRVIGDGRFASRVIRIGTDALDSGAAPELPPAEPEPEPDPPPPSEPDTTPALALLALLQREGRLVDFLQQDITGFADDEIGAAARVVHDGCRKALAAHATIEAVRSEAEETSVTVDDGYDPSAIKLTGKVEGRPPYRGTLRHAGWRVRSLRLPTSLEGHDPHVVAPAEVEL